MIRPFPRLNAAVAVFIVMSSSIVHAATVDIIATDLANPRGIAIGPAGRILIAEAGAGGVSVSMTGHVSQVFHGQVRRLLALPSIDARPGEVSGPTSVTTAGGMGEMFVTMGAGSGASFGLLLRANPARAAVVADLAAFEAVNNPDGVMPPDSNPYGSAALGNGSVLVADAAANDLLHVAPDGTIETVAVFPRAPNVLFGLIGGPTVQAVPTSVKIGPDGAWYVGELRGFPFANPSHIWRIEPGSRNVHCAIGSTSGPCIDWATGLRHVVSIAFDADGNLFASQFGPGPGIGLPGSLTPGSVARVDAVTKAVTVVYTGLEEPGGIAVDNDGTIYISNKSTSVSGELLRIVP